VPAGSDENLLITGLLQTEEYARVIVSSDPGVSDVGVDRLVEVRMRRQDRLTSSGAVALTAIMSQAALLQQIGGPGVLYRQLVSLVRISEARPDGIEIRVIPFTMTPGGLIGSSTLYFLEFASSHLTTVAWQESMLPIGIIEDPNLFRNLSLSYEQALEASLSRGESLELIQRCAQELKPLRHRGST
jgi:hypothetical protein